MAAAEMEAGPVAKTGVPTGSGVELLPAVLPGDQEALLALNLEYMGWVSEEVERRLGLRVQDEIDAPLAAHVAAMVDKLCGAVPPEGCFYLLRCDGQLAGMGGLRRLRSGVGELKRVYVRPGWRGRGLAGRLVERLLTDASDFGLHCLLLDTAPFMHEAHRLYERLGFSDCPAYPESELPPALSRHWRFMRRDASPAR